MNELILEYRRILRSHKVTWGAIIAPDIDALTAPLLSLDGVTFQARWGRFLNRAYLAAIGNKLAVKVIPHPGATAGMRKMLEAVRPLMFGEYEGISGHLTNEPMLWFPTERDEFRQKLIFEDDK